MEKLPVNNPNPVLCVDCQALLDENHALKDEIRALNDEVQKLRARLEEPEELQRAISEGDLDALVLPVSEEDLMVFTLNNADQAYRTLVETANEDIVVIDAEFNITYAGKRLIHKTGYMQEEVIGKPWMHFVDESSKIVAKDGMEQVLQGSNESYELKLISKDSSPYWVLISAKPLFDETGKFKGALAMLTDITKRKQAEENLRKTLESIGDGFFACDADWQFIYVNAPAERVLGINREEVLGKSHWDVFPLTLGTNLESEYRRAAAGEIRDFENFYEPWSRWFHNRCFPRDGGGMSVYFEDVTERKRAEEALRQSEQHYSLLFETMLQGVVYQDAGGKIISMNPAAERILGKTKAEFLGSSSVDEEHDTIREDGSLFPGMEHPAMLSLRTGREVKDVVMGVYNPRDKCYRWININTVPFTHPGGDKPFQVYTLFSDITDHKKAAETLQKSEEQYRTLFSTMDEGFCIIEMLFDENEKPNDYIFIEANPAFEKQTGLKNVIGKRMRELAPGHEDFWFEIYGKVALIGESVQFEHRAEALGRWYEVYAYRVGQPEDRKVAVIFNDITKRKHAEEQIRQRAEELEILMETTPVAIWIGHDPQSHSITGNRMANEFYEVKEGENVSANITPVRRFFNTGIELNADELPMQQASLKDINVRNVELDVLLESGKWRFMLGSASPLHDANGNVRGSVGAFIDITERKQMENALHESEIKYRNIVETANEGIWTLDADVSITYANNKIAEMVGYSPEEMIGKPGTYFVDNEYKKYTELRTEKRKKGIDEVHENKLVRKDGSTLWVLVNSKSLLDTNGKFTGILAMLTDITERKEAEEERERLLDQIQQEKDRLSSLVNSITDEVWFADTQKKISLVNPAVLNEFGSNTFNNSDVEAIAGRSEVYRPDGTLRPVEEAPPLRALQGEIVKNQEEIVRTPVHAELRYRQVNAAPVRNTSGKIIGSVSVVRDITERKHVEEALREAYEKLQTQSEELQVSNEELRVQSDELHEANVSLHDSVTGFRTLADNSPDLIARFDRQNRCLYANPATTEICGIPLAAEFYGWSLNEFIEKTNSKFKINFEFAIMSEKQRENVFSTGKPEAMEFQYVSPQGKEYYFDTKVVPEFIDGKVVSVLVLSRDITNYKRC